MNRVQVGFHIDGDVWEPEQITQVEEHGFDILTTGEHIVFFSADSRHGYHAGLRGGCHQTHQTDPVDTDPAAAGTRR